MASASGSKTHWAKPEDWDRFQNTITALFMCHSLPVVMRVMREEHQFHATPKMFQTQIYQKWGLRKTKPGEAKREAKARKRRREDSEDIESVSSSSQSRGPATVENSGGSFEPNSPTGAAFWQPQLDDPQHAPGSLNDQQTASRTAGSSNLAGNQEVQIPITTAPDSQPLVPQAWSDFINHGQVPFPQPGNDQNASACIMPEPQIGSEHPYSIEDSVALANESGSWISTVMLPTPPTSMPDTCQQPVSLPARSRSSHSSKKTRVSGEEAESVSSDSQRSLRSQQSQLMAAIRRPMGSIHLIDAPASLLHPERSMFMARHYISSSFSTGLWALSQSTDPSILDTECGKLERWFNDFNPAFDLLREQKVKRAFRLLKKNFANTKNVIKPQDPRVGIYVCQQAIRCMFYDRIGRNLAQTLLKYIAGLCQVLFGEQHPLHIMLDQLSRLDSFEFAQNIRPFMDCYFNHLEPFLETSNNAYGHITELRGLTISLMEGTGMMGIFEAKPILEGLVKKARSLGLPTLHLRIEMAAIMQRNRFFNEALSLLSEVRESEEAKTSPYEFHYAGIVLMVTLRKMKDGAGAIRVGYELVDFLSRPPSTYPEVEDPLSLSMSVRQYLESRQSSLLLVLVKLEMDLREAGRIEEADKIQARLDRGVVQDYGIEEVNEDPETDGCFGVKS